MGDEEYFINYFRYNPEDNSVKINICEYEYDKDEFDLNTELGEFIGEVNRLYDKCNDDRIICDTDANTEFYTREAIQNVVQEKLLYLNWRLDSKYVEDDEKIKIKHQIEIVEEIISGIDDLLY